MVALPPGAEFAGHRIGERLGGGGFGVVYRATHLALERDVAIKLMRSEFGNDDSFRRRFIREARSAAALDHPNVIPVYDAGDSHGILYIAMRYIDGFELTELRSQRGLRYETVWRIMGQVAAALDAAHDRGLVHLDVKPANVLIARTESGRALLGRFRP